MDRATGNSQQELLIQRVSKAFEEILKEINYHNSDYHHHTSHQKIEEWIKLADEIKTSL